MQIIYSVGTRFGGYGFGYIAYSIASRLDQKIPLKKIIALTLDKNARIQKKISTLGLFGIMLQNYPNQVLRNNLFDFSASLRVEKCDIFHGWSAQSLFSIRKARHLNALTFIERASSHILKQKRLIEDEYKKHDLKMRPMAPAVVSKCLKEFQEADFICVPSTFAYGSFLECGVNKDKIILLPYGVDLERFIPGKKKDEIFRVLYVGLLNFRKGVQYLLGAWFKLNLKNAQLVLAGPLFSEFRSIFKRYRNLSNIRYVGFIRNIENYYHQSSVLVLPSVEDGFGLVVLEAMACGIPVIVTENVGAKDCITDREDGFIVPAGDADSLADRLKILYDNPDRARLMGDSARLKAQKYPWDETVNNLIKIYTSTALKPRPLGRG